MAGQEPQELLCGAASDKVKPQIRESKCFKLKQETANSVSTAACETNGLLRWEDATRDGAASCQRARTRDACSTIEFQAIHYDLDLR